MREGFVDFGVQRKPGFIHWLISIEGFLLGMVDWVHSCDSDPGADDSKGIKIVHNNRNKKKIEAKEQMQYKRKIP